MATQISSDHHDNDENYIGTSFSKLQELLAEIHSMVHNFENLYKLGENLLSEGHYATEVTEEKIAELRDLWKNLQKSWRDRVVEIEEKKKSLRISVEVDKLEEWLNQYEAQVSLNEVGTSVENIEELLRKHDKMERMLLAREECFLNLIQPLSKEHEHLLIIGEESLGPMDEAHHDVDGSKVITTEPSVNLDPVANHKCDSQETMDLDSLTEEIIPRSMLSSEKDAVPVSCSGELPDVSLESNGEKSDDVTTGFEFAANTVTGKVISDKDTEPLVSKGKQWTDTDFDGVTFNEGLGNHIGGEFSLVCKEGIVGEIYELPKCSVTSTLQKEPLSPSHRMLGIHPIYSGLVQRKQELDTHEGQSVAQPWRSYFAVLLEGELHFYDDLEGFRCKWPVSNHLNLTGASCVEHLSTSRQGHIFRLTLDDKSQFLFAVEREQEMQAWMTRINSVISVASEQASDNNVKELNYDKDVHFANDNNDSSTFGRTHIFNDAGEARTDDADVFYNNRREEDYDCFLCRSSPVRVNKILSDCANIDRNFLCGSRFPMIVITDTNSNEEFLHEYVTSIHPLENWEDDSACSEDDTMSLPDHSYHHGPDSYLSNDTKESGVLKPLNFSHQPSYKPSSHETDACSRHLPDEAHSSSGNILSREAEDCDNLASSELIHPNVTNDLSSHSEADDNFYRDFPPPLPSTRPPSLTSNNVILSRDVLSNFEIIDASPPSVPSVPPLISDMNFTLPLDLPPTVPDEVPDEDLLEFIPPPVIDPGFDFLLETKTGENEVNGNETSLQKGVSRTKLTVVTWKQSEAKHDPSASKFSPRRVTPPPPPRPTASLLSDLDLPIPAQTSQKQHEKKDEKRRIFSGIFKRKK